MGSDDETSPALPAGPDGALVAATRQIAAWAASLPGLPPDDGNRYSIRRLTGAWNLDSWGRSRHTAVAHRRDLSTYLDWCVRERLDPLDARPTDLSQFAVWRELGTGGQAPSISDLLKHALRLGHPWRWVSIKPRAWQFGDRCRVRLLRTSPPLSSHSVPCPPQPWPR